MGRINEWARRTGEANGVHSDFERMTIVSGTGQNRFLALPPLVEAAIADLSQNQVWQRTQPPKKAVEPAHGAQSQSCNPIDMNALPLITPSSSAESRQDNPLEGKSKARAGASGSSIREATPPGYVKVEAVTEDEDDGNDGDDEEEQEEEEEIVVVKVERDLF